MVSMKFLFVVLLFGIMVISTTIFGYFANTRGVRTWIIDTWVVFVSTIFVFLLEVILGTGLFPATCIAGIILLISIPVVLLTRNFRQNMKQVNRNRRTKSNDTRKE